MTGHIFDAAVVGGGIVGLSSAYEMAQRGLDVVVIDKDEIGRGCAVGSAGHIVPSHVIPLAGPGAVRTAVRSMLDPDGAVSVRWRGGPALWRWLIAFARKSREQDLDGAATALSELGGLSVSLIEEWITTHRIECHRQTDGVLDVYGDRSALASAVAHAHRAEEHGVSIAILDGSQVRSLEPALTDAVIGAVWFRDDQSVDPGRFLDGLVTATASAGVTLRSQTTLLGISAPADTIDALYTSTGKVRTRNVVFAAGAWSGRMAGLIGEKVPVVPARGFSMTVDRPEIGPTRAMLLGERHVAVGPFGDHLRLSGRFEVGEFGTRPSPRRIAQIDKLARSRLHLDDQLTVRSTWAGLRPVTPDGVPIISRSNRWDNVTIATGHAMIGLSIGPGTGRLIAEMVAGEETDIDTDRFSIARFQ